MCRCRSPTCATFLFLRSPHSGAEMTIGRTAGVAGVFPIVLLFSLCASAQIQLSDENAYNPVPSPDAKTIAAVRTGWGNGLFAGLGRSHLVSEVITLDRSGRLLTPKPLGVSFIAEWSKAGIVSFRDWSYSLLPADGGTVQKGRICRAPSLRYPNPKCAERVSYLTTLHAFVSVSKEFDEALVTSHGRLSSRHQGDGYADLVAPSPDERYVALGPDRPGRLLSVYDLQEKSWVDLGGIVVSPDPGWNWMEPSWNPWLADSSGLTFFTSEGLVLASADGRQRRVVLRTAEPAGLAVPSPDGRLIAYATFASRPPTDGMGNAPIWNCTGVWVVGVQTSVEPLRVAGPTLESTLDLRWLDDNHLVYDRVEADYPPKARIWMVEVPR